MFLSPTPESFNDPLSAEVTVLYALRGDPQRKRFQMFLVFQILLWLVVTYREKVQRNVQVPSRRPSYLNPN
jgi:hypothetical protein